MSKEAEEYVKNNVFVDADSEIEYKLQAQRFVDTYDAGKSSGVDWHYMSEEHPHKEGWYMVAHHYKTGVGEFADWMESTTAILYWRIYIDGLFKKAAGWVLPVEWKDDGSVYAWSETLSAPPLPAKDE